jgi:uncharacterized protein YukE
MAGMGTTGTINMTKDMMDKAISAIDTYQTSITTINTELDNEIKGLIPSSFSGAAATGFNTFYTNNIQPNTGENLKKMLDSLRDICNTIKKQIPGDQEGVDDKLAEGNKGQSGSAEGNN